MNPTIVALLLAAVVNVLLGFFVLARNSRALTNRLFFVFSIVVAGWILTNAVYKSVNIHWAYYIALASYSFAVLLSALLALFLYNLSNNLTSKRLIVHSFMGVVAGILSAIPGVLSTGITKDYSIITTPLINLYGLFILYNFGASITAALRRRNKVDALTRAKINTVISGFALAIAIGLYFNLILPVIAHNYSYVQLGPFVGFILVITAAYAIVKHRLFDIRLVVARSVAYLLAMGTVLTAYLLSVSTASTLVFENSSHTTQQAFNIFAISILALTYSPLKRFFDKTTNKLFYRDAYDPQLFLDQLNKVLVATVEMEPLLLHVSQIIRDTLKAEFCIFGIKETSSQPRRVIGTLQVNFLEGDILAIRDFTPTYSSKLVVTDDLDDEHAAIRDILRNNNIALLARLSNQPHAHHEGYGYLLLGDKRSGNPYSHQDMRIIEIVADELVIAVQNVQRFEEIENFNRTLQDKIDKATNELRSTNEKLKALDQTKDDFISMASHQLRTPLTSVKGYVSMVLEGDAGRINAMQHKLLEQSFISAQRMVYLIADLLNVSRLRTGKFVIDPQSTNLADVVDGEISQLVDTARSRGLELVYNKPANFPQLMLDETKIRQVIMNFTDNAIYYTQPGGHITISLVDEPEGVSFTVVDNGMGVPKDEQRHLFTKFYRAANAKKARPDGTGLGLFMAKKVVAAQGGKIIFSSIEGKGSTFGFNFPKAHLQVRGKTVPHSRAAKLQRPPLPRPDLSD